MERYELEFVDEADKDFAKLDHVTRRRVIEKLEWLAIHLEAVALEPLGYGLSDFYKLKIGGRRVIYAVDRQRKRILVSYIDLRERIYKRLRRRGAAS